MDSRRARRERPRANMDRAQLKRTRRAEGRPKAPCVQHPSPNASATRGPAVRDQPRRREALHALDPLWDERFPAEQARLVQPLVERVEIGVDG